MEESVDLLLEDATIVTMVPHKEVIEGYLAVKDGLIKALGEGSSPFRGERVLDCRERIVFPGLINAHSHFYQVFLKGLGADLGLMDWVKAVVVPYSLRLSPELNYYATLLAGIESLAGGCTTITDFLYAHHCQGMGAGVLEALQELKMGGVLIRNFHDTGLDHGIPKEYIETPKEAFEDVLELKRKYVREGGLLEVYTGPGVTWGVSKEGLQSTVLFSREEEIPYSIHLLETEDDNAFMMKNYGKKAIEIMDEVDFIGPDLLAAHCVCLTREESKLLGERGARVVYNPVSNMYLGSGIPPIVQLLEAGATLSLGSDGPASNNSLSMMESLKIGALLQKVAYKAPEIITAKDMLKMATIDGAISLKLERDIGTLEVGKRADLFLLNTQKNPFPCHDPIATLVYSSDTEAVETTIVNGKVLYHRGEYLGGIDVERIRASSKELLQELMKKE